MSDQKTVSNERGCASVLLAYAVVVLIVYVVADMYADRRDTYHILDLQRRVAVLEQTR